MPSERVELLRGIFDLHNSAGGDFPDLLVRDHLHPDAEFVESADVPGAATHRGRDAVGEAFRQRFEAGTMRIEDLELAEVDDRRVLAAFRVHMLGAGSGVDTSMRVWQLITLEGTRIARLEEFNDDESALRAARAPSRAGEHGRRLAP